MKLQLGSRPFRVFSGCEHYNLGRGRRLVDSTSPLPALLSYASLDLLFTHGGTSTKIWGVPLSGSGGLCPAWFVRLQENYNQL